jgi:hypothetical protein
MENYQELRKAKNSVSEHKMTVITRLVHSLSRQRLIDTSEDRMPHGRNDMHVMAQEIDI